jgi:hypothetical protein
MAVLVLLASSTPLAVPLSAAPARAPVILQVYATAETSSSAAVVWNTNVASDSRLQYSTRSPVPPDAPQVYLAAPATYHEIPLSGLMPATLYHYRVTSCAKKGCATATGSFDTFPSCPDEVPPISGSWQREPSPNVSESIGFRNELLGVAAISEGDVWAVGWAQDPAGPPYVRRALIQHFDGTSWNTVPSPNRAGHTHNVLHGVSGTSSSDVWAVGFSHDGTLPSRTLIQHWDGTQWTIVPSPSPQDQLNELRAVAAISADDAWAVGFKSGSQTQEPIDTFVLHWDGSSWTQVPSPNLAGGANQLFGITAVSADDIWAVGFAAGGPLAMHWNGSTWSLVPVARDAGLGTDWLTGVSGKAADDVWAVGQGKGVFSNQTFATLRHWDGTRWTDKVCRAASASNPPDGYEGGGPDAYFTGISATARDDVWAVGVRGSGPIILHWDGAAWTTVTHPRAFPRSATPRGVTTSSGGAAWSVGVEYEIDPTGQTTTNRTLVYRYR